jgi:hypothetical protein
MEGVGHTGKASFLGPDPMAGELKVEVCLSL